MLRENSLSWALSFILGISLLIFSFLMPWLVVRNRFDGDQPLRSVFTPLTREANLSQTFVAKHDLINIVILYFKNPGLANKGEYQFLLSGDDGKVLIERSFSGFNIGDPSDIRFQFEPITSSKNKKFTITLKSMSVTQPSIGVGNDEQKGLSYSVYYRTSNKKLALIDLVTGFAGRFFSDISFSVFWLLAIITIVVFGFFRSKTNHEEK